MPDPKGRLVVFDKESHLEIWDDIIVGDTFDVVRGNGLQEGELMGFATVTELSEDGPVEISIHLWEPYDFAAAGRKP